MTQKNHSAQCAEFPGLSSFDECQELFSNAPIGIYISTPEGRFISVNPAMALLFGYDSPNDMIESITDIAEEYYIDPSDREEFVRQMLEQGQVVNHECQVRRRDGAIIWVSRNAREIRDKNGKITHYQGFVADITEPKRSQRDLQDNKELLELITDNMRDMVSLTDLEGNFEFVGRSHQLLGYEEQLKYLSLHDQLTGLYNRAYLENELQRLQHSRDFPISIICMDLDGLKLVNDTLGHDHGDKHLRDCAQILQESSRAADIVARFGGG